MVKPDTIALWVTKSIRDKVNTDIRSLSVYNVWFSAFFHAEKLVRGIEFRALGK